MDASARRLGIAVAASLCLFVRVLIPAGYMPAPISGGWYLQICHQGLPAAAVSLLYGDHAHHHHHHDSAESGEDPGSAFCPTGSGLAQTGLLTTHYFDSPQNKPILVAKRDTVYAEAASALRFYARGPPSTAHL